MIAISDLEFQFPHSDFRMAVPSLKIARAERLAIIGPSGSGKTTLLHLIAGILSPTRGTIRVQDREMSALGDAARRAFRIAHIGLVFQSFELVSYLDVFENILLPYRLNPALRLTPGTTRRAEQLARETGLENSALPSVVRCCRNHPCCLPTNRRAISIPPQSTVSLTFFSNKSSRLARRC